MMNSTFISRNIAQRARSNVLRRGGCQPALQDSTPVLNNACNHLHSRTPSNGDEDEDDLLGDDHLTNDDIDDDHTHINSNVYRTNPQAVYSRKIYM